MFLRPLVLALFLAGPLAAEVVIVKGSAISTAPLVAAAPKLKELGIELKMDSEQNTSSAIASLGAGLAQIAVATRPLTSAERAAYPHLRLEVSPIAYQLLALVVPADLWNSGVRALTREQVRRIYEGEITDWKEVGGPARPIKFLNPEQGRGVWEVFATWLYGDTRKAPLGESFEKVATSEETRNVVEFNAGALSVISPLRIDGRGTFGLAVKTDDGEILPPTAAGVRDQGYPITRSLDLISGDRPAGPIKKIIDFMRGPAGQEILKSADYVPVGD